MRHRDQPAVERSNPAKLYFPDAGITKGEVVDYYERVAELALPHLRDRPVVMQRFPDGIEGEGWYQKEAPSHFPSWIRRAAMAKQGGTVHHVVVDDTSSLVYLANQGMVTPHVWLSRADRPDHPDQFVVDLDPGADRSVVPRAARAVKDLLEELGMPAFAKTSGSKGIHVHVPLDRSATFAQARAFGRAFAAVLEHRHPDMLTTSFRKDERGGKLFLDVHRNAYAQHAVAPYGVRALPGAPVAVPLDWREATTAEFDARRITVTNVFRRLGQKPDPWTGFAAADFRLAAAVPKLDALAGAVAR